MRRLIRVYSVCPSPKNWNLGVERLLNVADLILDCFRRKSLSSCTGLKTAKSLSSMMADLARFEVVWRDINNISFKNVTEEYVNNCCILRMTICVRQSLRRHFCHSLCTSDHLHNLCILGDIIYAYYVSDHIEEIIRNKEGKQDTALSNPWFKPLTSSGLVHSYQFDESISNFRGVIFIHF